MNSIKDSLSKRAVRISMGLVILFAITVIAMTAKFVLFYSSEREIGSDTSSQGVMNTLDKELFDAVTAAHEQKTADKSGVSADIRDPFSDPYEAPPPSPEPEEEAREPDDTEETPDLAPEPASEE